MLKKILPICVAVSGLVACSENDEAWTAYPDVPTDLIDLSHKVTTPSDWQCDWQLDKATYTAKHYEDLTKEEQDAFGGELVTEFAEAVVALGKNCDADISEIDLRTPNSEALINLQYNIEGVK